jgi:hypothetical protein
VLLKRSLSYALIATAALVIAATLAVPARAGVYTVPFCARSSTGATDSWTHSNTSGSAPYFFWSSATCGTYSGRVYRRFELGSVPAGASDDWTFDAPEGTYVSRLDMYQDTGPRSSGAMNAIYSWQEDGGRSLTAASQPGTVLSSSSYTFPLSGSKVIKLRNSLLCQDGANCAGLTAGGYYGNEEYWSGATVHLVDPSLPVFSAVTGEGWKPEPADGQRSIQYSASDAGSGVKEARFYVDGILQSTESAACVAERLVPCPLTADGGFTLDTTKLSEGQHALELTLVDGASNEATKPMAITVRRAPVAADPSGGGVPVTVTDTTTSAGNGAPAVGDQLHGSQGTWTGSGLSFAYQWLRCAADGAGCVPIPGANGVNYTPTSADIGHALQFCVTASNSGGSATSCSVPTAAVIASRGSGTTPSSADPVERPGEPTRPSNSTGSKAVLGDRGQPNGSPAADTVVLTALANNRSSTIKSKFGKRVPIGGRLLGPNGAPIAGAVLDIQTRTAVPGAAVASAGKVVTGDDGRFSYVAPAGPSRVIRFAYRSHSADTSFADTTDVTLLVSAGVTIKATPARVHNRHATVFVGRLLGKPISKRGVVVDLQVFFRNKWRTFGAPRTNKAGRYRFKYRFMAGTATWRFRARVRRESSYPYMLGYSLKTVKVTVVR